MALASFKEACSPVELSLSPVYHYQFSSIAKVLNQIAADEESCSALQQTIQRMCMRYFNTNVSDPPEQAGKCLLLQTDTTPVCKPHSPTLEGRTYVAVPNNVIRGNKPLSIGYELSFVNLSEPKNSWSLPLSVKRVASDQTATECALEQLSDLFSQSELPFSEGMVINTLDSKYGNASYLAAAYQHKELVNVVRLRAGMRVWKRQYCAHTGGAPRVYGEKYYLHGHTQYKTYKHPKTKEPRQVLQSSVFELAPDETLQFCARTAKGRKLLIVLWRWKDMMIRSKDGHNMKDKPFDLIASRVSDAQTGETIFQKEMFAAICGKHKDDVSLYQGYQCYRHRYDIEHYLRFAKQHLMLEKFQTPEVEHFHNWLLILQLASWLLYAASDEAHFHPRKWESYPAAAGTNKPKMPPDYL